MEQSIFSDFIASKENDEACKYTQQIQFGTLNKEFGDVLNTRQYAILLLVIGLQIISFFIGNIKQCNSGSERESLFNNEQYNSYNTVDEINVSYEHFQKNMSKILRGCLSNILSFDIELQKLS